MCASSELQFGALREGGGTQEVGGTVAESLVVLYRVGTHCQDHRVFSLAPLPSFNLVPFGRVAARKR